MSTARLTSPTSPLIFKPGTDLAILNYIANHIVQTNAVNRDFIDKHVNFRVANTDIGYGLRPEHVLEQRALHANDAPGLAAERFDAYAKMLSEYTLDPRRDLSGVSKERLEALAKPYADPKTKVMSLWTMGFNQHVRGVWANHLVYNIHLLTGKIAEPGNSPFSLTGQPSACGTAREVGAFAHRLPADMQVTNPSTGRMPSTPGSSAGTIPDKPGFHAVQQDRMLKDGKLNAYWIHLQQQSPDGAEHQQRDLSGLPQSGELHRCLGPLSHGDHHGGRRYPSNRHVGRKGGRLRQRRAAHAHVAPARQRAGRSPLRPVAADGVLQALHHRRGLAGGPSAKAPEYRGKTLFDVLFATARRTSSRSPRSTPATRTTSSRHFGFYVQKGLFEEYAGFGRGHGHDFAPFDTLPSGARPALAGGRRQGDALALPGRLRSLRREGIGLAVLRQPRQAGHHHGGAL